MENVRAQAQAVNDINESVHKIPGQSCRQGRGPFPQLSSPTADKRGGGVLSFPSLLIVCVSCSVMSDSATLCWRRLFRVPWTARRSNQSSLREISPGISLEEMMLKLKLQYFGHLMRRVDSLEKTLMLVGIGGRRRRGRQKMRWLDGITD